LLPESIHAGPWIATKTARIREPRRTFDTVLRRHHGAVGATLREVGVVGWRRLTEGWMDGSVAASWPRRIGAITLFVEDLAAARAFYMDVFGLAVMFEDDDSAVFDFGNTVVNLLRTSAVAELIAPAALASPDAGTRFQLTVDVGDVDAVCALLAERRVPLLNGPVDRPWGVRTASFVDPGGHIWEVAAPIAGPEVAR
jgi:catechol 2,3-dioxygenase-like lactoylglutathione lyase family enzyme